MENKFQETHKIQLELALELKRICEMHHLRYFLMAGSLLGAVRHKGFIPWDDDMDIALLRVDYDKFLAFAKEDLSSSCYLQNWNTEASFGLPFSKIRKKETVFAEKFALNVNIGNGIYIDVYPIDNFPENKVLQKWTYAEFYFLKKLAVIKNGYCFWMHKNIFKKAIYQFLKLFLKFVPAHLITSAIDNKMIRYKCSSTQYCIVYGGDYGLQREIMQKKWFEKSVDLSFENNSFSCSSFYDEYLTNIYGNYMVPPKKSERGFRHQISRIEIKVNEEHEKSYHVRNF